MVNTDFDAGFDAGFSLPESGASSGLDASHVYDALVLGAGPAGLSAAIYLIRKGIDTAVIASTLGGQVSWTASIENYLGYRVVEGAHLVAKFREQLRHFSVAVGLDREVDALSRRGELFAVRSGDDSFSARSVVLATGKRPRLLGVPGERELLGRGVAYCAICDAPLYKGKVTAVVGGGNSGLEAAIDLARLCPKVYLFECTDRLGGDAVLVEEVASLKQIEVMLKATVTKIHGKEKVEGITWLREGAGEGERIDVQGVFVETGLDPNSEAFGGLPALNERGEVVVDALCRTSVPGIFAAGDVTSVPYKQIIIAAGEGAKAALSAYEYLRRLPAAAPGSSMEKGEVRDESLY